MTEPLRAHDTDADLRNWFVEWYRPTDEERDYEITDVVGEIPQEIHGTFYRNGPSQRVLPKGGQEVLHFFDGDGLVHAFRFDDGRLHYRGRFVRNESFLYEEERGAFSMSSVGVRLDPEKLPGDAPMRVQHNTNVVLHAGRLLALVENGLPFEIERRSLDPIGPWPLDGRMLGYATSAHPKIDARTGEMVLHGYSPFEPFLQHYVVAADGAVTVAEPVDAPYPVMMHDMAITDRHVVYPLCPIVMDGEILASGGRFADAVTWQPDRGMFFGIRPREKGGAVRWIEAKTPGFLFHFGNAWEENGKIVFDACLYEDGGALLRAIAGFRRGDLGGGLSAHPYLWEIDLASGTCVEKKLDDRGAEFPRCDDRLTGYRNRWGYAVMSPDRTTDDYDFGRGIVKYDRTGGPSVYHRLEPGHFTSEPVFVPRSPDAEEDDGFLLSVVYEGPTQRSHLLVLDARDVGGEPLARARLAHRIPGGFHGNFVAEG